MINERGEFVRETSEGGVTNSEINNENKTAFTEGEFNLVIEQEENKRAVYTRIMELVG